MSNLRIALLETSARRLLAAHAQSCVGSGMAFVGLPLLAYEFTGSAWAVTAVLLPEIAPAIVLGPLLGALIDRFGWRRTMIAADVLRALAFLAVWQAGSLTMAVIGAFVAGLGTAAFNPAALTALGALTPDGERRAAAMGLFGALDDAGLTLGPALAGLLLAIVEPAALMAVNAATFALSALLLMTLRGHDNKPVEAAQEPSLLAAAVSGWREIASRPRVKLLLASSTAAVACVGINNVGEVILAREVLGVGGPGLAALLVANGIGLIAGSLAARDGGGWRWRRAYQVGLACMAVELLVCATGLGFLALLPVFVIGGFGNGHALVHDRLLLASAAPPAIHGRMFAFQKACTSLAFGAAFVAASVMIGGLGVQLTFLLAGVALVVTVAATAPRLRRAWPAPAAAGVSCPTQGLSNSSTTGHPAPISQ
jgi:predicted MFS family arabinose efflux permease